MSCGEFTAFLMGYLDGEVSAEERARFEEHLAECAACVAYLRTYRQAVALGKAALADPDDPRPADVPEELVRAIMLARRAR